VTANGSARYGIYFAPREDSALWHAASAWLGRDAASGLSVGRPAFPWIGDEEADEITASPRHYGFHGTLKAPFALAKGETEDALDAALTAFAAARGPFGIPLEVGILEGFLALRPTQTSPDLHHLADACVEAFEPFRAPAPAGDLARRRKAGLTPLQDEYLSHWGYPYVFDAFRFHMTLTNRLHESSREALQRRLAGHFSQILAAPVFVDSISLFFQPSRETPFRLIRRYPFGGRP